MPRNKQDQKLFDELGEVEYRALKKYNKNLSNKRWRDNNKNYYKEYRDTHKEEINEYQKEYQEIYRDTHQEEINEYQKEYRQTPKEMKRCILKSWKEYGITFGDMTDSEYYDNIYLPATICQSCEKVFNKTNRNDWKCADHTHDILNLCNIRGVICNQCKIHDQWKTRLTDDSIYQQYL